MTTELGWDSRPVTAWECSGLNSCRDLVDEPGGYCLRCESIATDAWFDAMAGADL